MGCQICSTLTSEIQEPELKKCPNSIICRKLSFDLVDSCILRTESKDSEFDIDKTYIKNASQFFSTANESPSYLAQYSSNSTNPCVDIKHWEV